MKDQEIKKIAALAKAKVENERMNKLAELYLQPSFFYDVLLEEMPRHVAKGSHLPLDIFGKTKKFSPTPVDLYSICLRMVFVGNDGYYSEWNWVTLEEWQQCQQCHQDRRNVSWWKWWLKQK